MNVNTIKMDLGRLGLLRRSSFHIGWKVKKTVAKHPFEERTWERTGKKEIFPTEAGKAKLLELYQAGELTMKADHKPHSVSETPMDESSPLDWPVV